MKKGKILWMAVIAAMVLVPTMSWGQTAVATQIFRSVIYDRVVCGWRFR